MKTVLFSFILFAFANNLKAQEKEAFDSLSGTLKISPGSYSRLPIDSIRKMKCVTINSDRIVFMSADVYFSSSNSTDVTKAILLGSCFDDQFLQLWSRLLPGSSITFDLVKVIDLETKRVRYMQGCSFVVTGDK